MDVLLVSHRKIDVEGADNDGCVVASLQDKGHGSSGLCAAPFHWSLEGLAMSQASIYWENGRGTGNTSLQPAQG